ncbi:MAG: DUF58 domain-containing protein, partial [Rubrivivax sp.]|nr:DUF58 domain-containing protein [Rubrivivax sp.]
MSRSPPESPRAAPRPLGRAEQTLHRLDWTVIRRLDGALQGDYRSLFRGTGLDLADLREYQHHDDPRHIDWNVTARLQVPHVRQYNEDRDVTAWFLVDLSPSVGFGSNVAKTDVAVRFTGVVARLLTRRGNRVGAMLYGHEVDTVVPAGSGRQQVLRIMHRMMHRPPLQRMPGGTRLDELLRHALSAIRRRSIVFVVSDFIAAPGWDVPLGQLASRHDVIAVRLYDPLEMDLPDLGLLVMQDAETGEQVVVDTQARGFRHRFATAARRREAELRDGLARAGVDTLELATEDDLAETVPRFAQLRKRRVQLSAGGALPAHLLPQG